MNRRAMFKKLTNFKYKRTGKEAFGFYIAYLLLSMLLGGVVTMILSGFITLGYTEGVRIGVYTGLLLCIILLYLIISVKKLHNNFGYIVYAIITAGVSYLIGNVIGMILVAYLTTKKAEKK